MKVARYVGNGNVSIVDEVPPVCPPGGLLIRTEACGLCSGELMAWYMDQKIPHVLGHEVAGIVLESQDERFPEGCRVFPHHHAPCGSCEYCLTSRPVHCAQWKSTKLVPGGMAEFFAVSKENLTDTIRVDDLRPIDAALIEPLGCVMKSFNAPPDKYLWNIQEDKYSVAVIGLGVMGLMHLAMVEGMIGYDLNPKRIEWARRQGFDARHPDDAQPADAIFVCPGSQEAFDFALSMALPGASIVMFAPLAPGEELRVPQKVYFQDLQISHSYSCGPTDTQAAANAIRKGKLKAEQVVSDFIGIEELPEAYRRMKDGEILKAMVTFP